MVRRISEVEKGVTQKCSREGHGQGDAFMVLA